MAADLKSTLSGASELARRLYERAKEAGDEEQASGLFDLRERLGDLREEALSLAESNETLRERVGELEHSLEVAPELVRHKGVYWRRGDPDPWCPSCFETDRVALHLNRTELMAGRLCTCRRCQYTVNLDNVYPPREWRGED